MKVAVLCEFSGIVRDAFIRRGHDAISCDLLPTESPGPHIQGDCLAQDWSDRDLLIVHPPCTYLCNSGVRWLWNADGTPCRARWDGLFEAMRFFRACLDLALKYGCRLGAENPKMHGYARVRLGAPTQFIQPWQFGHGETKETGLWLRGLPKLRPTQLHAGRAGRVHREPPGADRWKRRSLTYQGVAEAMAEQWGSLAPAGVPTHPQP